MRAQLKRVLIATFVAGQLGCSLGSKQPPTEQVRASLGTIGVIATAAEPEIKLPKSLKSEPQGRTTIQAVGEGAKGALVGGAAGSIAGFLLGILIGAAACAPAGIAAAVCAGMAAVYGTAGGAGTGALAGGTYAAMKEPTTQSQAVNVATAPQGESLGDIIRAHLDIENLRRSLSEQLAAMARRKTDRPIIVLQDGWDGISTVVSGEPGTIDTALELKIEAAGLVADQPGTVKLFRPYMRMGTTLVRVADRQVLYSSSFEYSGAASAANDWASEAPWQKFSADAVPWLAETIVDQLFVTAQAAPPEWLLAVKKPFGKAQETLGSWFSDKRPQVENYPVENGALEAVEPRKESVSGVPAAALQHP